MGGNEATATLTDRSLAPGVQALTAVYGGDLVNQESTSAPVDFSVGDLSRNVTSTSVAVPSGNLAAHQSVALTANVAITVPTGSPGTAAPTGTVTFLDGAVSLGSLGFVAGASTAAFTTTLILPDGTSVVDTQTVNLANSASAANTASWKDSVIAGTETVSTSAGGTTATFTTSVDGSTLAGTEQVTTAGGIPTATFAISLDGATLMNWSTADGVVTTALGTQALSDGAHFITALYSGDLGNLSSTAAPVIVQVGQKTTVTSLSNTVVVGQPVVATVTIQGGGAGAPTGTVTFIEGSTTFIAPVVDVGGVGTATWTSLSLAPGNYPITAQYNGDADDAVSSSGPTTVAIAKDLTQVSVTTPSPTSIAGTVTLTAAVTAVLPGQGTPTGSVTFYDGATALGSAQPLIQGSVTYTATISSAGTQTITANYSGDTADAPASGTLLLTIVNAGGGGGRDQVNATTTTLSLPSQATLGQSVTLTAVVSGSGTGTISGTLSFYDGTTLLQTRALSNGGATAPLVISSPSTHSITAIFVTDGSDFASSSSGPSVIQIVPDATQTALSVQSNPGYVGQPESLKAVVAVQSPGAGTPTGSVTFYDGPLPIGVAPLQTGSGGDVAALSTTLSAGYHLISAVYAGDTNDLTSSTPPLNLTVGQTGQNVTQTVLSPPSLSSPTFGAPDVLTAKVSITQAGTNPDALFATGTVTFFDDSTSLGTAPLSISGGTAVATLTTTALPLGSSSSITADYSGDANDIPSFSTPIAITVTPTATITSVTASNTATPLGQLLTLTATVAEQGGGGGAVTGEVTFSDGATVLGSANVVGTNGVGTATFFTTALALGDHSISAAYGGDANNQSSANTAATPIVIGTDPTGTLLVPFTESSVYGQALSITTIISGIGTSAPTGQVSFFAGSLLLGTSPISTAYGIGTATISTSELPAGTDSITAQYNGDTDDAQSSSDAVVVTISPALLSITADNQSKVYGAGIPTLTARYSGFVNGDSAANLTTQPTLTTSATAGSHVSGSPYPITASGAVDPNYTISYSAGSLTITPVSLTITATNQSKAYGATLPALAASFTGFVNGDTAANLTTPPILYTTATSSSAVVGSPYPITVTGAADPDYMISYVAGTFTVTPASLTISASSQSMVYGAPLPTLTALYSGFVNGDSAANLTNQPTLTTSATAASHVVGGPYAISASGAADPNYTISYSAASLTITPAPLTITATNQSKLYAATLPALTASFTGFVNGDTAADLTTPPTLNTTATPASGVAGSPYPITGTGAADPDYTISYVAGSITVTPVTLTISASNQTKVYGAPLPALTAAYSGFVNGDSAANLTTEPTLTTSATAGSHVAGSPYPIAASGAVDPNYTISYSAGSLTITPAPLTITGNNQSKVYGATLPALTATYKGFASGDTAANLITQPSLNTTATSSSAVVGSPYPITVTGAADPDYTISYVAGTFTVTPASLTISASSQAKVYGAPLPTLTALYSGFVNGDSAANLTNQPTLTTSATAASHVVGGPYAISVSGAADSNYTISYAPGMLTITPVAFTYVVASDSQTYGTPADLANDLGIAINTGINGQNLDITYTSTGDSAAAHVGRYGISGIVSDGTGQAADYSVTLTGGTLTVSPYAFTFTIPNDHEIYGSVINLGARLGTTIATGISGQNLDIVLSSTGASQAAQVGTYAITGEVSDGSGQTNDYTVAVQSGTLTIAPTPLTITALPATMTVGQPLPSFGVNYSGLVLGQSASVLSGTLTLVTQATSASPSGVYQIVPGGLSSSNYAITYVDGTLVVTPAGSPVNSTSPVTVTGLEWETVRLSRKKTVKELVVRFSGSLNPGDAMESAAYSLDSAKIKKKLTVYTKRVPLAPPSYNAANNTVTLVIKGTVPKEKMQLTINAADVVDALGRQLDGNNDGQPGGNYVSSPFNSRVINNAQPSVRVNRVSATAIDAIMVAGYLPMK